MGNSDEGKVNKNREKEIIPEKTLISIFYVLAFFWQTFSMVLLLLNKTFEC